MSPGNVGRDTKQTGEGLWSATVMRRLGAGVLDAALLSSVDVAVVVLILRLVGLDLQSFGLIPPLPLAVFLLVLNVGYVLVLTATGGQTFGKMVFGLRVVHREGGAVNPSAALFRIFGLLLSLLPLGFGFFWILLDSERRALHDLLAETRVVRTSGA